MNFDAHLNMKVVNAHNVGHIWNIIQFARSSSLCKYISIYKSATSYIESRDISFDIQRLLTECNPSLQ